MAEREDKMEKIVPCYCWVDRGWGDGIITEPLSISKGMGITMN